MEGLKKELIPENIKEIIQEHHNFVSNSQINEIVDDDDYGIQVFLRKGEDETLLQKPSLALFYGDRGLYSQEVGIIKDERVSKILNTDTYPRNKQNFQELRESIQSGVVIPFVGAGLSISAGCPSWEKFLQDLIKERNIANDEANALLADKNYEELMSYIIKSSESGEFELYFEQDFRHTDVYSSPSMMLPKLFDKCVITTNFDSVVEESYREAGMPFDTTAVGLHDPFTFLKSVPKGKRCLLKLHGDVKNNNHRVLTHEEYEEAYGDDNTISYNNHLPQLLKRIYLSYTLFFIGCSMNIDRTIKTFEKIVNDENSQKVPEHYALIEQPETDHEFQELKRRLITCNIKPIWFSNKEYNLVEDVLSLLMI